MASVMRKCNSCEYWSGGKRACYYCGKRWNGDEAHTQTTSTPSSPASASEETGKLPKIGEPPWLDYYRALSEPILYRSMPLVPKP